MEFTLIGHQKMIDLVTASDDLIVSTASDHTIRVWNKDVCQTVIPGMGYIESLFIFEHKIITSHVYFSKNTYKIKVWNLNA